jgi:hypothetical protein
LIKNISPTPPNARDAQPRTSVPQLPLRRSVNPPGRGPLHIFLNPPWCKTPKNAITNLTHTKTGTYVHFQLFAEARRSCFFLFFSAPRRSSFRRWAFLCKGSPRTKNTKYIVRFQKLHRGFVCGFFFWGGGGLFLFTPLGPETCCRCLQIVCNGMFRCKLLCRSRKTKCSNPIRGAFLSALQGSCTCICC